MAAGFIVAFALAAVVLTIFGVGNRGTAIALRVTARWSFLLFWLAYAGSATGRLFGIGLAGSALRGRELGLAFASAQLVHVGLVLWLIYIAARPGGAMLFFWAGIVCTFLLALFSLPRLRRVSAELCAICTYACLRVRPARRRVRVDELLATPVAPAELQPTAFRLYGAPSAPCVAKSVRPACR